LILPEGSSANKRKSPFVDRKIIEIKVMFEKVVTEETEGHCSRVTGSVVTVSISSVRYRQTVDRVYSVRYWPTVDRMYSVTYCTTEDRLYKMSY
jgi:hypothetical protein